MNTTVHEHLARLADEATPASTATSGRDLWERGRRYQRRRRTGTALIAGVAAVLVLAIGTVSWQRGGPGPEPVPAGAPAGLPDRVYDPSGWLPGTDSAGPLGQVAAVMVTDRAGWLGSHRRALGISATTGEYRFLDLPGQSDEEEVALAPDGRHIAYWSTGKVSDTPNTSSGQVDPVTAGVAVYDTVTGDVVRHQIDTAHGLWVSLLAWVDEDSLMIDFNQYVGGDDDSEMDQSSGQFAPALRWDLGRDPVPFPELDGLSLDSDFVGPSTDGLVAVLDEDDHFAVLDGGSAVRHWKVGASMNQQGGIAIDPTGTRVAGVSTKQGKSPNRVGVARLPEGDESTGYTELPRSNRTFRVLGWSDTQHLMVERRLDTLDDCTCSGVFEVDATTGAAQLVVELPESSFYQVHWASDLLGAPVVDRPAPPTPVDPRLTASLLTLTLGIAGILIVRWRRRVEA